VLEVQLVDISLADAPAVVLAREEKRGFGGPPVPFALVADTKRIEEEHTYAVAAAIRVDGALWFRNTIAHPVLTHGGGSEVAVQLDKVGPVGDVGDAKDPEEVVIATNARLEGLETVEGTYGDGDMTARYTAWLDGDHAVFVAEQRQRGSAGRSDARFWFHRGVLVRFEEDTGGSGLAGGAGSAAGTRMRIDYWGYRYLEGAKTVDGAATEPDEQEVRAAWRQAEELLLRIAGAYETSRLPAAPARASALQRAGR
jgi:putative lipoprotein